MRRKIIAVILAAFPVINIMASDDNTSGVWHGTMIITPQVELKIVFNFKAGKNGEPSVTFDSPYQGAYGIAGEMNFISADSVNMTVCHIGLTFSGRKQNGTLIGKCSHGAMSTNLELSPAKCISDTHSPIFAPYGEKDIQIRPELNMLPMRQLATNVDVKIICSSTFRQKLYRNTVQSRKQFSLRYLWIL